MDIGLVVPVLNNFTGFAQLINSVDERVQPIVLDNWNGNRGVAASWNEGIRRGWHNEALIIVNDDVAFYPGTIEKLAYSIRSHKDVDLISAIESDTGETGLHYDGKPDFCCFVIRPIEFVDKFGWFDENFTPAYFEDNDMHYRIIAGGGTDALRLDARVSHGGSVTQFKGKGRDSEDRVVSHERFRLNRMYYVGKWGGPPGEEIFTTPFNRGGSIKDTE